MNYHIPQLIWLLFNVKMIHINVLVFQQRPTLKNRKQVQNIIIGVVIMNLNLIWGGFFSNIIQ